LAQLKTELDILLLRARNRRASDTRPKGLHKKSGTHIAINGEPWW